MPIAGLAFALLFLSVPEGDPLEADLVDKPEPTELEARREALEKRIGAPVPFQPKLRLARGDARFLEITLPLKRAPKGPLVGQLVKVRTSRELPFAAPVEVTVLRAPQPAARMVFAVRAEASAARGTFPASATLELREGDAPNDARPLASTPIELSVEVVDPVVTREDIELDRQAYLFHQSIAVEAYGGLSSLHDLLRLDRADPPPSRARVKPEQTATLERFVRHRLRADIARARLRAAVDASDPALSEAAIRAIGALSKRPTGPAAKARIIEGEKVPRALALAKEALLDARFDEAEGILNVLRQRGGLTREEVATDLVLLSAVYAARGRPEEATQTAGRALCIHPPLEVTFARPMFGAPLAEARTASQRCTRPIAIESVLARRRVGPTGAEIVVEVTYGPDPLSVIAGAEIEFWGPGGGVLRTERVRAAGGSFEVIIPDTSELENYTGQLLLKVAVREFSGVAIATFGHPEPGAVPIGRDPSASKLDIPWWVWAVAGGVAAVGALTAVAITVGNRETQYGIGPIHVEF